MKLSANVALLCLCAGLLPAQQDNWFDPAMLGDPKLAAALASIDAREDQIIEEWIQLTEIPSPSGKEQQRAAYIRAEMEKLGLSEIRTDDMLNVSGVRKGSGGGPSVVFAAHTDTVFPEDTPIQVKRDGDNLVAPGIGDDTSNVIATLEMFRALDRAGIETKGDLIFLASSQEELGLLGAAHWLKTSGYQPDMFLAVDGSGTRVGYGALRMTVYKFFFSGEAVHTLESRGEPNPAKAAAKAISAIYDVPLPPIAEGLDQIKLPTLNVGTLGGGTVMNAIPSEVWFTVDLRSLDNATQDTLSTAVVAAAREAAEAEGVNFRLEATPVGEFPSARPSQERLADPVTQTSLAVLNYFQKEGSPVIQSEDMGSTDANNAVGLGIPAVSIGAVLSYHAHRLEEYAEASSIVPGTKALLTLAVALTTHQ